MRKGVIFRCEQEAMNMDWKHNKLTGSVSMYHFHRVKLKDTNTLTKAEYAEIHNIPATVQDIDGNEIDNPKYTELEDSITMHKYAAIVHTETPIYQQVYNEETGETEQVLVRNEVYSPLAVRDEETNEITGYACPYCGEEFTVVEITDDMVWKSEEV